MIPLMILVFWVCHTTFAYTYTQGTFTTSLNCQWFCLNGSPTNSCFCVLNGNTNMTWTDAQAKCVSDGGYLARIVNADEQMMMESLVSQYGWNRNGQTNNSFDKQFYIGLQRGGCNNSASIYYWRDNCKQPMTNDTVAYNVAIGYSSALFNVSSKTTFPFGCCMTICSTLIFWYTNNAGLGPWQDDPITNDWIGQYAGAYCRRDLNPCGSNPCTTDQTCFANNSCYYCLQTTSTSTSSTSTTTSSTTRSTTTTTTTSITSLTTPTTTSITSSTTPTTASASSLTTTLNTTTTTTFSTTPATAKKVIWWPLLLLVLLSTALAVGFCAFCFAVAARKTHKQGLERSDKATEY